MEALPIFEDVTEEWINAFAELTVCDDIDINEANGDLKPNIRQVWIPCYFYLDEDGRTYIKYFSDDYDIDQKIYIYDESNVPRLKRVY